MGGVVLYIAGLVSIPCMLEKYCNGNPISTFPPCYAFQMIFTALAPRLIQSISRNVHMSPCKHPHQPKSHSVEKIFAPWFEKISGLALVPNHSLDKQLSESLKKKMMFVFLFFLSENF